MAPTQTLVATPDPEDQSGSGRPVLADQVVIYRGGGGRATLTVNGEPFPFLVEDALAVDLKRGDATGRVHLTLLSRSVHVLDDAGVRSA